MSDLILSSFQKEILNGLLLGDGCLFKGKANINPLLIVGRASKDVEYLKYHYGIFQNLCSSEGLIQSDKFDSKRGKTYTGSKFRTRSLDILLPYYNLWYPEGKKIIPPQLELTPTIVATWFADDGALSRKKDRKGNLTSALKLKISTNSFSKGEVEFLASQLSSKIGGKISLYEDNLDWYKKRNTHYVSGVGNCFLQMYTESAWKFYEYIKGSLPAGIDRKFSIWKDLENGRLAATSS